jgi:hypothetical protein
MTRKTGALRDRRLATLAVAVIVLSCSSRAPIRAADANPRPAPQWAVAVFPSGTEFDLEIAADPMTRARGYMERERVGPREGMLFIFDA